MNTAFTSMYKVYLGSFFLKHFFQPCPSLLVPGDCLFSSEGLFGWWTIIPGFSVRRFWLDSDNHLCNSDLRFDTSLVGTAVWPDYCSHFFIFYFGCRNPVRALDRRTCRILQLWTSALKRRKGRSWGYVWVSLSLFSSRSLWRVFQKPTRMTDISVRAVRFHLQRSAPVWNVLFVCLFVCLWSLLNMKW